MTLRYSCEQPEISAPAAQTTAGSSVYRSGSPSHWVLSEIAQRPIGRRDLEALESRDRHRRKIPYVLSALVADGMIHRSFGEYRLTAAGRVLLESLDRQAA